MIFIENVSQILSQTRSCYRLFSESSKIQSQIAKWKNRIMSTASTMTKREIDLTQTLSDIQIDSLSNRIQEILNNNNTKLILKNNTINLKLTHTHTQ